MVQNKKTKIKGDNFNMIKRILPKKIYNRLYEHFEKEILEKQRKTNCKYELNILDEGKLEGKVAIVTGGSGAIGSAICFRLAMEGAIVIVCGRNKEKIDEVLEQIKRNKGKADGLIIDVTNYDEIEKKFNEIYIKYKKIDILVNNAGGSARDKCKYLNEQDIKVVNNIIETNLLSAIYCSKIAEKYMLQSNYGKIINIGSTTGVQGNIANSEYSAAKSGLIGFTKSLAMEIGKNNINVNMVSPGRINQIMFDKVIGKVKDNGSWIEKKGETDDVAKLISFLVSDDSDFITGQNIIIDGGRTLGLKGSG